MPVRRLHAYFLLLLVALIWGIAGSVIKFTQEGISTLPFLTYRFAIAGIFGLGVIVFSKDKLPKDPLEFAGVALYGILISAVSLGLLFWGVENTSVVEMNLISATSPLVISVAGVHFLKEHLTKREKFGLLIAFIGTLFVIFEPFNGIKNYNQHVLGNFLVFGYVLINAYAVVMGKRLLRKGYSPKFLTNSSFVFGFLAIAIFSVYKLGLGAIVSSVQNLALPYHLGVIYMALISGTLAYLFSNKAQKSIEVGESSVFGYLIPIFGVPVAIVWLGEKITTNFIVGAIIIALGVFVAEIKKKRYN